MHLEGVKPLVAGGSIVAGGMSPSLHIPLLSTFHTILTRSILIYVGAMLNSHPAEGETPSFKGSMMLAQAENEEEVRKILENDIYVRSGVWDMEKAQIIPVSGISGSFFEALFASG